MDDLARAEYPGMLANLQPGQAVQALNDRVKRISKINLEIADWLQERRRVEEQYVLGLRKLSQFRVPNASSELGVFQGPWGRIIESVERIAKSHHVFAERLEQDVEQPLRAYQQRRDYSNMHSISNNLSLMAKDFEDAQDKSDKLNKKGYKASAQKVDAATSRLESASQQWESQAPFIFETLQALDESRINQLRDLLTQYQTHEADQAQRAQENAVEALAVMLEISTEKEIHDFAQRTTHGKPPVATRTSTRRSSMAAGPPPGSSAGPPSLPTGATNNTASSGPPTTANSQPPADDDASEHNSAPPEVKPESKLRRLGTMFGGRRRQSVHAGFGQLSPQKGGTTFGRLGSSHGRGVSPRASSSNLHQDSTRLSSLAETPDQPTQDVITTKDTKPSHEGTNGVTASDAVAEASSAAAATEGVNGTHSADVSSVAPPPGPPPSQQSEGAAAASKDAEGFTIRAPMNDPISEAQREAAGDDADQLFKLSIQNKPVEEEDPEAKLAAFSSVANTLKMGPATRRSGTVRGRRDVRNTIYVPAPSSGVAESQSDGAMPSIAGSPPKSASSFTRPPAVAALASEASVAATSDTQSVRSGNSLGSLAHAKHPEMTAPGLNSSIIETVSAVFEDGVVTSASIAGEIAFANNASDSSKTHETIRINRFPSLERIGPNRIFVQNASPDQPDQFTLDVSHLAKTSVAFSYRVFTDEADGPVLGQHAPLLLRPAWKPQGDKLGLLLQYQLNQTARFTSPVTLHNVVFLATYEGRATGAQTKPSGTHLKEQHLVYWRLGDVTLTPDVQKIVCRIVGADGACPTPGRVEARWEYAASGDEAVGSGISISRLDGDKGKGKDAAEDDPFADESLSAAAASGQNWVDVPVMRKLVSGKYEAK